jgi:hypothetical protein
MKRRAEVISGVVILFLCGLLLILTLAIAGRMAGQGGVVLLVFAGLVGIAVVCYVAFVFVVTAVFHPQEMEKFTLRGLLGLSNTVYVRAVNASSAPMDTILIGEMASPYRKFVIPSGATACAYDGWGLGSAQMQVHAHSGQRWLSGVLPARITAETKPGRYSLVLSLPLAVWERDSLPLRCVWRSD